MGLNDLLETEKTAICIGEIAHIYENTLGLRVKGVVDTVEYDDEIIQKSNLKQGSKVIVYMDKENGKPIQAFTPDGEMFYNKD